MAGQPGGPHAWLANVSMVLAPEVQVPPPIAKPQDLHPLPPNIDAYCVYPFAAENAVMAKTSPVTSRSVAAMRERHASFLAARRANKEMEREDRMRRLAPGWVPDQVLEPTLIQHLPPPRTPEPATGSQPSTSSSPLTYELSASSHAAPLSSQTQRAPSEVPHPACLRADAGRATARSPKAAEKAADKSVALDTEHATPFPACSAPQGAEPFTTSASPSSLAAAPPAEPSGGGAQPPAPTPAAASDDAELAQLAADMHAL